MQEASALSSEVVSHRQRTLVGPLTLPSPADPMYKSDVPMRIILWTLRGRGIAMTVE